MRSANLFLISTPTVCFRQDTGQRPSEHPNKVNSPSIQGRCLFSLEILLPREKRPWARNDTPSYTASRNGAGLDPILPSTALRVGGEPGRTGVELPASRAFVFILQRLYGFSSESTLFSKHSSASLRCAFQSSVCMWGLEGQVGLQEEFM